MLNHLCLDLILTLVSHLSYQDISRLSRTCRSYRHTFYSIFHSIQGSTVLIPSSWNPIRQYALLEGRRRIFPEMHFFYSLTSILQRCLKEGDETHFNYFWHVVIQKEEKDPWNQHVNYQSLLQTGCHLNTPFDVMNLFCSRYNQVRDDGIPELVLILSKLLVTYPSGDVNTSLLRLIEKNVSFRWQAWILDLCADMKCIGDTEIDLTQAMIDHHDETIISFLQKDLTFDRVNLFAQSAIKSGRKDLLFILQDRLPYRLTYQSCLGDLQARDHPEMTSWLRRFITE